MTARRNTARTTTTPARTARAKAKTPKGRDIAVPPAFSALATILLIGPESSMVPGEIHEELTQIAATLSPLLTGPAYLDGEADLVILSLEHAERAAASSPHLPQKVAAVLASAKAESRASFETKREQDVYDARCDGAHWGTRYGIVAGFILAEILSGRASGGAR